MKVRTVTINDKDYLIIKKIDYKDSIYLLLSNFDDIYRIISTLIEGE